LPTARHRISVRPISTPIMRMLTVVGTMIRSVESGVALLLTDASST
jgi:hypothetical protein